MAEYKLITGLPFQDMVLRISDGAFIPTDPGNQDYQTYLIWLDDGNIPDSSAAPLNQIDNTFGFDPWQTLS